MYSPYNRLGANILTCKILIRLITHSWCCKAKYLQDYWYRKSVISLILVLYKQGKWRHGVIGSHAGLKIPWPERAVSVRVRLPLLITLFNLARSSRGLGLRIFIPATRIRIPYALLFEAD